MVRRTRTTRQGVAAGLLATIAVALAGCATASRRPEPPLLFERCCYDIWVLPFGGTARYVTGGDDAVWLAGHSGIAFTRVDFNARPGPATSLWTARQDGSHLREVLAVPPPDQVTTVASGSGPLIVYGARGDIWSIRPDGSSAREVLAHAEADELAVSPSGLTIVYAYNGNRTSPAALKLVTIQGRPLGSPFAGTSHTCGVRTPAWSPDGRWIAFALCVNKGGQNSDNGIWLVHPSGRGLHRIATTGGAPTWSPDGDWIAYSTSRENAERNDELTALVRVHPDGTHKTQITPYVSGDNPAPGEPFAPESPQW